MDDENKAFLFNTLNAMTVSQIYDLVVTLNDVIEDTANELGCESDNEEILMAIHNLKNKKIKAEVVTQAYDNGYKHGYQDGLSAGEINTLTAVREKVSVALENAIIDRGG